MKHDQETPRSREHLRLIADNGDDFARPRPKWVDVAQRGASRFCYGSLCLVAALVVFNLYRLALS
jgi:hypothetical protein